MDTVKSFSARRVLLAERTENLRAFPVGSRIEMHPATDAWMSGDRFGTVERLGQRNGRVYVRMDRSGKLRGVYPHNLQPVA